MKKMTDRTFLKNCATTAQTLRQIQRASRRRSNATTKESLARVLKIVNGIITDCGKAKVKHVHA
jgi:hypothetical protein